MIYRTTVTITPAGALAVSDSRDALSPVAAGGLLARMLVDTRPRPGDLVSVTVELLDEAAAGGTP